MTENKLKLTENVNRLQVKTAMCIKMSSYCPRTKAISSCFSVSLQLYFAKLSGKFYSTIFWLHESEGDTFVTWVSFIVHHASRDILTRVFFFSNWMKKIHMGKHNSWGAYYPFSGNNVMKFLRFQQFYCCTILLLL